MVPDPQNEDRIYTSAEVRVIRQALDASVEAHLRTLDELRRSEDGFSRLVQSIRDYAIFMLDPDGYIISWNEGAQRLKGYTESEIVGQHFSRFYTPEDRARDLPATLLRRAEREGRTEHEGWRVRKDGTLFWADVVITALRATDGHLIGFGKVVRDLTERRRAEDALRRSEERFRLMVDSVRDLAIFMLDPTGHIISWNPGAERTKGYTEGEVLGKHFSIFYGPEDVVNGKPERGLALALRNGRYQDEGWRVRKDGSRFWADVVITPVRDEADRLLGFVKVTRDLTERRRAEEDRLHLQEERIARSSAEESIRLRDEFLGVAAHELKTPVTSLRLQAQLAQRRLSRAGALDSATVLRAFQVIQDQSDKLTTLVGKLLDVSRISNGRLILDRSETDVAKLVAGVLDRMRALAPDRTFDYDGPTSLAADVDPVRLEQVVVNLLDNAVKYSREGPITTSLRPVSATELELTVRDLGPGVPEVHRAHLFDRFYQTDSRNHSSGMGLGLYISKQIVELHRGSISAEFPAEGGSQFVVRLPR
jgi:PAS domain S-box-containing protein